MTVKEAETGQETEEKAEQQKLKEIEKKDEKQKKKEAEDNLSDEDRQIRDELYTYIEVLQGLDGELYLAALEGLSSRIRDATCSMTSVPKPLKFLKPRLNDLIAIYDKLAPVSPCKSLAAEIVSVVGMTAGFEGITLKYRLYSKSMDIAKWGHEYIKHLSAEMCMAGQDTSAFDNMFCENARPLMDLAHVVVPYFLAHNSEADAVDLLGDFECLEFLREHCDQDNYKRVGLYMTSCANYLSTECEELMYLKEAHYLYLKFNDYYRAMLCALRLRDGKMVRSTYSSTQPRTLRLQLAYLLAMNGWREFPMEEEQEMEPEMLEAFTNGNLSANFLWLGRELDIMEPKSPEDVYKNYLIDTPTRHTFGGGGTGVTTSHDQMRRAIADALVNGFVNAGFCKDKVITNEEGNFFSSPKDYGLFTAVATLGIIYMWDIDGGLSALDRYTYSTEEHIKGGALFACGLASANVQSECDPVLAICSDVMTGEQRPSVQLGAVLGLGVAYAGTGRRDIMDLFLKCLEESDEIELNAMCVLCAGIVGVGTCEENQETVTSLLNWTMSQKEVVQLDPLMKLVATGIALFYFGRHRVGDIQDILTSTDVLAKPLAQSIKALVHAVSCAGTGDMTRIQKLLQMGYSLNSLATSDTETTPNTATATTEDQEGGGAIPASPESPTKDASEVTHAPNVIGITMIGIGLIAMGDEIGTDMAFRMLCQLLHIGNPAAKKAVLLAIALLAISNPKLNFMDTLIKFAHDSDQQVACNAVISLGLIGAGTNNARIASMLRQLSTFHSKDSTVMLAVRVAQGLVHMGKGTLSLNPFRTDRFLLNPAALSGILAVVVSLIEPTSSLTRFPYHLLLLGLAAHPRFLMTVDESTLKPLSVTVRVGQAVDIVGQAGNPKSITGFQTHDTPVLMNYGERAELTGGEEEFISRSPVLEGVVLLQKVTEHDEKDESMKE